MIRFARASKDVASCSCIRVFGVAATAIALGAAIGGCAGPEPPIGGGETRTAALTATPALVQSNSATPQSSVAMVTVAFNATQAAGNLNLVVVGWSDTTAHTIAVSDSKGNSYALALGPQSTTGAAQSIYYAKNIGAGAGNTVNVTFSPAASFPDIRVLEYSGIDPVNALDVAVGATGNSASANSGSVTTTNAADILIGANDVSTTTKSAGTNYALRMTTPDGDMVEDRVVAATGSYNATASLTPSGRWVMQLVAFRAATLAPDTQPPTAPANLTATAASSSQIGLGWTAATDNVGVTSYLVERCQGAGCSTFAQVGTSAVPSFTDTGLVATTPYSYRVRATDAAGNLGPYSNTAGATTQAAPTVPVFVQATAAVPQSPQTSVSVLYNNAETAGNLNVVFVGWGDASAHTVAVNDSKGNSYQLAVGPTQISGASQSIYYARNIAGGAGNSVMVSFSPAAPFPDIRVLEYAGVDPLSPLDVAVGATGTSTTSSSTATTTNANDLLVAGNDVTTQSTGAAGTGFTQRVLTGDGDIVEDRVVTATGSYTASAPLSPSGAWVMQMAAFRAAVMSSDTQPPTAPSNLTATAVSVGRIDLAWTASTDNVGVTSYLVERCQGSGCSNFTQIGTTAGTTFSNTGILVSATYSYRVRATDAANNLGPYSNIASATSVPDTTPPTPPANLTATAVSATQVSLSWTASTDDVGVTSYLVERCQGASCATFTQVGTSATASFADTGLTAGTSYSYRVRATDAAGNLSDYSNVATAATPAPDTQPPTAPSNLAATAASSSQINVSWGAATDNVGVTAYLLERCQGAGCSSFAQMTSTAGLSFPDTGRTPGVSYSYRVRATDAAGNLGPYTAVASATTPNPPATPAFVQAASATPQSPQTAVPVGFTGAQTAGNLNVVLVGWGDSSAAVTAVSDSKGNVYQLAVGPTQVTNTASQSIYYAKNIAGGSGNNVTVSFSPAAAFPDVRIVEYSGIDPVNAVDATTSGVGTIVTCDSGPAVTANANDLLVAGNDVATLTTAAGTGFTQRVKTQDGDIVEDRLVTATGAYDATATVTPAGGWVMQLVAFRAAGSPPPPPPDTQPPTTTVTAPTANATVGGTVSVTVTASDPSGVGGVQLLVDGLSVGPPDTTSPYTFTFNSATFGNGAHTIGATAWDTLMNVGGAPPVPVTFSNANAANPAQSGVWSGTIPITLVSVHSALLSTGKILLWDGQSFGTDVRVFDPVTSTTVSVPAPVNVFCSGLEQMTDGRIMVIGGHQGQAHVGITAANAFDPITRTWTVLPDMATPRWYPSASTLPDGRILAMSGETSCNDCEALVPEIYNPGTNAWTQLTNASFSFTYYPHVFGLPDGRVLVSSTVESPTVSQILDLGTLTWTAVGGPAVDGSSAVMYQAGKVLKSGKSFDPTDPAVPSVATAYVLDLTQSPPPAWRQVASMAFPRMYHTLTMLPDGSVLVTGGGTTTGATDTANAVLPAEVWSPTTETWTTMAPMNAPRLYHSEAILMPDARVLILGGGRFDDLTAPTDQFSVEFFSPPYLFKGPRPTITGAPATLSYGQPFTVQTPDAARIASVSAMRLGAITHAVNMGQRFVPLSFTAGSGTLTVTGPASANVATPGYYLLFIVDSNGVPSVAATVHLQ